ncbi:MAG: hypothetical protein KGJ84_16885 [Elusimicrobia bacterium]|nr:hypothetical protein [Elusimicrobiota bacterium]
MFGKGKAKDDGASKPEAREAYKAAVDLPPKGSDTEKDCRRSLAKLKKKP